jgi:hypothetical protein
VDWLSAVGADIIEHELVATITAPTDSGATKTVIVNSSRANSYFRLSSP